MITGAQTTDEQSTPTPLAKELISDAALELQLIRARQISAWRAGRVGPLAPCEVIEGSNEQLGIALLRWMSETRVVVSIHDDPGPIRGWFDMASEHDLIRGGYRMASVLDAGTTESALQSFLAEQDDQDYRVGFAPLRIKLLDRLGVVMEGPVVEGQRTLMLMKDRAALAAGVRYANAVRASAWRVSHDALPVGALSGRQQSIALMLASGLRDIEIAERLGVSLRTVRGEVSALLDALGAETRYEAGFKYALLGGE
jgi:DNA-binding CsgD family transcriptional regulator